MYCHDARWGENHASRRKFRDGVWPAAFFSLWLMLRMSGPGVALGNQRDSDSRENSAAPAGAEMPPLPVPGEDALTRARKSVDEVFGDEVQAATTAEQKRSLVQRLLQNARDTQNDPSAQYVLYLTAYDNAISAASAALIDEAINSLATKFHVDRLRLRASGYFRASNIANTPELQRTIIEHALVLMDEAVTEDRFDIAVPMEKVLTNCSRRLRDAVINKQLRDRVAAVKERAKEFELVAPAREALLQNPESASAHGILGRYLCLAKADWDQGLAHLSRSDDATLRDLAAQDLARPESATDRLKLADGWYDLAASTANQAGFYARADHWYRQAMAGLTGLNRRKAEQRLQVTGQYSKPGRSETVTVSPAVSKILIEEKDAKISLIWAIRNKNDDHLCHTFVLFSNGSINGPNSAEKWVLRGNTLTLQARGEEPKFTLNSGGLTGEGRWLRGGYFEGRFVWIANNPKAPVIVNVWDFKAEGSEELLPLIFFANGRVNDPNGKITWSATEKEMSINFPEEIAVLQFQPDGSARGTWRNTLYEAKTVIGITSGDYWSRRKPVDP